MEKKREFDEFEIKGEVAAELARFELIVEAGKKQGFSVTVRAAADHFLDKMGLSEEGRATARQLCDLTDGTWGALKRVILNFRTRVPTCKGISSQGGSASQASQGKNRTPSGTRYGSRRRKQAQKEQNQGGGGGQQGNQNQGNQSGN
eukprot:6540517-Prorocentrum_lima.AAC.1